MRELPEPDGDHDRVFERGTVVYTKESVLAIQKQAYEDGLRDAASLARSISDKYGFGYFEQGVDIVDELDEKILAMLTASQKEQQ